MNMKFKSTFFFIPLFLANLFCSLGIPTQSAPQTPDISVIVSATLTASASPVGAAIPTAAATMPARDFFPAMGTVSGQELMFPASAMPALRIAFINLDGSLQAYTDTAPGQNHYTIELPVGSYTVVAYSIAGNGFIEGTAGGFTPAVACGLNIDCTDHSLIPITITAGLTLEGINPNDYYAPENSFPPMPH
jgi:hypothetical protein